MGPKATIKKSRVKEYAMMGNEADDSDSENDPDDASDTGDESDDRSDDGSEEASDNDSEGDFEQELRQDEMKVNISTSQYKEPLSNAKTDLKNFKWNDGFTLDLIKKPKSKNEPASTSETVSTRSGIEEFGNLFDPDNLAFPTMRSEDSWSDDNF